MRTRIRDFPGTDRETNDRLALEVARDEEAFINAMLELRRKNTMSLEAIGFLLGADPSQISRYLKGRSSVTVTNYLRLARALGYRCQIVFKAVDDAGSGNQALSDLKLVPHKVCSARRSPGS
jgi:transcriptional regulator with XRE-family HTH domain